MNAAEFRKYGYQMIDYVADYYEKLKDKKYPVFPSTKPGDVIKLLPKEAPLDGEPFEEIQKDIDRILVPNMTHWQHPNFFAFFPSNTSFPSILGELLSSGFGVNGMMWMTCPASTELEMVVVDWMAKILKLPDHFLTSSGKGGGIIQSTASETILVSLVAARNRTAKKYTNKDDPNISSKIIVYASEQTHSSCQKSVWICGIPPSNYRVIKNDKNFGMNPAELKKQINLDREQGYWPCFVCATVGSTSLAAVDPIAEIGKVAQEEGIWLHIDAAFAGSACICPEYRYLIDGVELADSFNFNPHKWLRINFDCSLHWVKDRTDLEDALSISRSFFDNKATSTGGVIDYKDWTIQLGRRFKALKIWFVLRTFGVKKLQNFIREHCNYAKEMCNWVKSDDRFELLLEPFVSLLVFRIKDHDDFNTKLIENINEEGKFMLTPTHIQDKHAIRVSIGVAQTTLDDVKALWKRIQEETDKLFLEHAKSTPSTIKSKL